jgi:hypothetical protein
MAYSIRPRNRQEIYQISSYRADKINLIAELYDYLTTNYREVDRPLILNDSNGGNKVKVHPEVAQLSNLNENQLRTAAHTSLTIAYGVGSGGGRARYNMGNAAEGILAAAIAARFINKGKRINQSHILEVLATQYRSLSSDRKESFHVFKSENFRTSRESTRMIPDDDVELTIKLSPINMSLVFCEQLLDRDERAQGIMDRMNIMTPSIEYANSREISQLANVMYYNRMYNKIEVEADGVGGELTTKVDIFLRIDGQKHIEIPGRYGNQRLNITQISLKREVNQFAQVGGWDIETVNNFWGSILNENILNNAQIQAIYSKHSTETYPDSKRHAAAVMIDVYQWAHNKIQQKFSNAAWREHFINKLDEFATKNEENVKLVEITGSTYEKFDFSKLHVSLNGRPDLDIESNLELRSTYNTSVPRDSTIGAPLPTVVISARNKNDGEVYDLVQFRHKIEWGGTAIRNYVEKQNGLAEYIAGK